MVYFHINNDGIHQTAERACVCDVARGTKLNYHEQINTHTGISVTQMSARKYRSYNVASIPEQLCMQFQVRTGSKSIVIVSTLTLWKTSTLFHHIHKINIIFIITINYLIIIIIIIIIIRVLCPRAGLSLQIQEPRLQFCPKASLPLQSKEPMWQFY